MKKIIAAIALTAIATLACWEVTAFKSGEYNDPSRGVKVCVYNYANQNYTYAVSTIKMCPMTIKVCR